MIGKLAEDTRQALACANHIAQQFNHEYIGTEHILLGTLAANSGGGVKILASLGADPAAIRARVESRLKAGPDLVTIGSVPQAPRARKVIELAIQEAQALGNQEVTTEDLLVALLRVRDGIAAEVLGHLGIKIEDVTRLKAQMNPARHHESETPSSNSPSETKLASMVLARAIRSSQQNNGPTTADMLLAILEEKSCLAARALSNLGLTPRQIRSEIDRLRK
ncbi:MAG TPA: Clp protease N-terminal domain-containing protein [Phycisphaerae bacterium]|jgi:ATP-dependent Clp protease ATP-binding subunit ClpA|nr:Clp protease N-terminal domain-containing protein [Phycisphaerae bacterium]